MLANSKIKPIQVLEEDLRQICIREVIKQTHKKDKNDLHKDKDISRDATKTIHGVDYKPWWDYNTLF